MSQVIAINRPTALLGDQDAAAIGELYRRARSSAIDSVRHLIDAGSRLIVKKNSMPHGAWLRWLQENSSDLGFETARTAQKLMKIAGKYDVNGAFDQATTQQINRIAWGNVDAEGLRGTRGTGNNEWFTPREYIEAARAVLEKIDLDPASHPTAQAWIAATSHFTEKDDALDRDWHGRVWLNPPYAREVIDRFAAKMIAELQTGRVTAALMLTHNYTDTNWFQTLARTATAICFPRGRIKFIDADGSPGNPTQGQAFFYFGPYVERFVAHFAPFGFVAIPAFTAPPSAEIADTPARSSCSTPSLSPPSSPPTPAPEPAASHPHAPHTPVAMPSAAHTATDPHHPSPSPRSLTRRMLRAAATRRLSQNSQVPRGA